MMLWKRPWVIATLVLAAAGVAIAGVGRVCTRPRCACGIPAYDYQYRPQSRPQIAVSQTALLLEKVGQITVPQFDSEGSAAGWVATQGIQKQIRYFQLDRPSLAIDHCSISQVVLQLHDNGFWVLSLHAEQNPQGVAQPVTPSGAYTAHLKRNQFVLNLRCFGAYTDAAAPDPSGGAGRPVLFELGPVEFWVQRGKPYTLWRQGRFRGHPNLPELVDRVEIDFSYR